MKRSELILMMLQVPIDFCMLILAAFSGYSLRFTQWALDLKPVLFTLSRVEYINIVIPIAVVWVGVFGALGLYRPDPNKKLLKDFERVVVGCVSGLALISLFIMFTQDVFVSRFLVLASAGFAVVYVVCGRLFLRGIKGILYRHGVGLRRVVVVGSDKITEDIIAEFGRRKELGYLVVGTFSTFTDTCARKVSGLMPDELIFTSPRARQREALKAIEFCHDHHIIFKYSADLFDTYSTNIAVHPLAGVPMVELRRTPLEGWGRVMKRMFDIVGSLIMIVLTSPIMLLTAVVILFETGRPIIYKNERVGVRKNHFFTLKFRSMYQKDCTGIQFGAQAEKAEKREQQLIEQKNLKEGPVYKIDNDPRVTRFGRFIRRWKIDELPQFFNVLGGSMSMVGPRPHQPREVAQYEKEHYTVFTLKPGITGLAQISGRGDLSFADEVQLDILYIEKWSLLLDMVIFIKTPFVLLRKAKTI